MSRGRARVRCLGVTNTGGVGASIPGRLALGGANRKPRHAFRELFDAGNLDADGNIIDNEMVRLHKKGDRLWHTDSSFMDIRSA